MTRLLPPGTGCREMQIGEGGPVYPQQRDGTIHVENKRHERLLRQVGATPAGMFAHSARGWRCPCGHLSYFRTRCGRCGRADLTEE